MDNQLNLNDMNIYQIKKVIEELEEIKNPYYYDKELLKFYKRKKEQLINKINNKIKKI
tara:strand:+ start:512 stop:685 length:174 start_codon:yes stop_codon:yes gene_type:complete